MHANTKQFQSVSEAAAAEGRLFHLHYFWNYNKNKLHRIAEKQFIVQNICGKFLLQLKQNIIFQNANPFSKNYVFIKQKKNTQLVLFFSPQP